MRILFAQKLPYLPALSGAAKVGRFLLEALAQRDHACRVVALMGMETDELRRAQAGAEWAGQGPQVRSTSSEFQVFDYNGVEVHAFADGYRAGLGFVEQIRAFEPTRILIAEDPTYLLLSAALETRPDRTVFLSLSQATLPFGPEAFAPDPVKSRMLADVDGIVSVSRYLKSYIQTWGGLDSFAASLPVFGAPPFPYLGSPDNPYVTMINPSAIKGAAIFSELARRFPDIEFAAVPTWATTAADRAALERLPNIRALEPDENIDAIFAQTSVLVVPSLWGEAFGMVVVEGMLRGIPVLASRVGGLPEAKLGIDYLLPVRPIERYEGSRDDRLLPTPVIPAQDIEPWAKALHALRTDRFHYRRLSAASRQAALDYVASLSIVPLERYLEALPPKRASIEHPLLFPKGSDGLARWIDSLSPEKRELLAALLEKKRSHQNRARD
jgi:hypothetical protein